MSEAKSNFDEAGDALMKAVGALEGATADLKSEQAKSCKTDPNEVGNWITIIGKALLSIFK